ncbi:MAG: hypothetical protein HY226_04630 [Candidatus Vogelbacteria bacterium]|nr:hypothetical protein [Candidatus Vogelbacteria bacterium]
MAVEQINDMTMGMPPDVAYLGGTVLELIADRVEPITDQGPPQTPPQPFQTHTTSGEGIARISDDTDQEYLHE